MKRENLYKNLPETAGVYSMKNAAGRILYIGKAANLRRRVSSYFLRPHDARIESLISEIATISYENTDSSIEALIRESALIKRHMPSYNIREKDDTSFLYVVFTKDKFPRVLLVRGKDRETGLPRFGYGGAGEKGAYGPFVSASSVRAALRILRKIFPWSDHHPTPTVGLCGTKRVAGFAEPKPCFNYQIGLCAGTCIGVITRMDYAKNIRNLKLFFKGEKKKIMRSLEAEMRKYAIAEQFEKAEFAKRKLFALRHIQDTALIGKDENAINVLSPAIAGESTKREIRIEGYDISTISGTNAVGAMVVFTDGVPDKAEYRTFNIRTVSKPDDVSMMREVLTRRFENKEWPLPQAILVDGGLGQVNVAQAVLREFNLKIPVIGIAKGANRKNNRLVGVMPRCATRELLVKIRDEAHRFSHSRHIRLRNKKFLP